MDLTYSEKNLGSKSTIVTEKRKENCCFDAIESNLNSINGEKGVALNDDALLVFEYLNDKTISIDPEPAVKSLPKLNMKNTNISKHLNISHLKSRGILRLSEEISSNNKDDTIKYLQANLSFSGESSFQTISESTKKDLERVRNLIRELFYKEREKSCLYLHLKELVKNIYEDIIKGQNLSTITDLDKKLDTEKGSDDWSQMECNREKENDNSYFSKQLNSLKYDNISMKAVLRSKDTQIQNLEGGLKKFENELSGIKNFLLKQPSASLNMDRPVTTQLCSTKVGSTDYIPTNTEANKGIISRPQSTLSKLAKGKNVCSTNNLNSFLIKPKKVTHENSQISMKSRNDASNPFCQSSATLGGIGPSFTSLNQPESCKKNNVKASVKNIFSMSQLNLSQLVPQKAQYTGKSSSIDFASGISPAQKKAKESTGNRNLESAVYKEGLQFKKNIMTSKNIN